MIDPSDANFWSDNPAVVLPEQLATAVYTNGNGDIVIRQQRAWDEDSDTLIIISKGNARRVADALIVEADEGDGAKIAGYLLSPDDHLSGRASPKDTATLRDLFQPPERSDA